MKKVIYGFLLFASIMLVVSCSDDDKTQSTPTSLSGTSWHFGTDGFEGGSLRFVDASSVYMVDWEYEYGEYVEDTERARYVYNAPLGVIYTTGEKDGSNEHHFTVNGNKLTLNMRGETYVFTRR